MVARALVAFLALPGVFALAVPWAIAALDPWRGSGWPPGVMMASLGLALLLWCVRDFYVAGRGTLAPWDPPRALVVIGLYRHVRNPMYLAVLTLVGGWMLATGSPLTGVYLLALAVAFHLRVVRHEEPWLAQQFGPRWDAYRARVPRWIPGLARGHE